LKQANDRNQAHRGPPKETFGLPLQPRTDIILVLIVFPNGAKQGVSTPRLKQRFWPQGFAKRFCGTPLNFSGKSLHH
jgi:hypothetical protein